MKNRLLCTLTACCMAAATFASPGTIIKGTWGRKGDGLVKLFRVDHGRLEEVSTYRIGTDKTFGFYFTPEYEGVYALGTGNAMAQPDKYNFYFKGGDQLNLVVNDSSYTLTGVNSMENTELTRWHDLTLGLETKSMYFSRSRSTYEDFFPELEVFATKAKAFTAKKTGNKKFDIFFPAYREFDLNKIATSYIFTPRTKQPGTNDYTAFYKNLNIQSVTKTAGALNLPFGVRIMSNINWIESRLKGNDRPDLDQRLATYINDTLKGEVILQEAQGLKTYLGYQDLNNKFSRYILTADQKSRLKEIAIKLAKEAGKPGQPAVNFTYPDLDGKMVSLTDFKGKVVLVDVWATWCGPCKAEIPSLKKMEEEMRDKNIVFMSVSVDEQKDHEKWKDFVATEGLKGVQLFAAGWSDIAKFYDIKGIPRFMVFDKNGDIVTINAPRPSSTELKLLLESKL